MMKKARLIWLRPLSPYRTWSFSNLFLLLQFSVLLLSTGQGQSIFNCKFPLAWWLDLPSSGAADSDDLTILAQEISWPIVELHCFLIQLPRIEWGWIENPGFLARRKNTTVNELRQRLAHYLRGRINLGELTWDILGDTHNTLREVNDRTAGQLENMNIGTKRYLLGIYRYLTREIFRNTPDTRDALEWTVRLQYYFRIVLQRLQRAAEEEQRTENERAGSAERAE
uniref:ARAD1C22638p n=1 Tax=Blastobotrys adeninivorans TaxID=409370 RepID=A0A060T1Q4_BLAAD